MNHEVKPKRPRVITVAACLTRLILCASVSNWLFASPVAPESQQQPLLFCSGKVVQLTDTKLLLQVGVKPPPREFAIATRVKLVDEVHVNDSVNATYIKKGGRDIVVVLQRLPDIEFNEKWGKEEPMGVSDLVVPAPLSARIFAAVAGGEIEARPPESGKQLRSWIPPTRAEPASYTVEQREQGVVASVTRLNPFESELRLYVSPIYVDGKLVSPAHAMVFILDPLTRIVGHLKAGTRVNVLHAHEKAKYASEVVEVK